MVGLVWNNPEEWNRRPITSGRRGARSAEADALPPQIILPANVEIEHVEEIQPAIGLRSGAVAAPDLIDVSLPAQSNVARVVLVQHPSGALTFHLGDADMAPSGPRGAARRVMMERFRIPVNRAASRRGVVGSIFKFIVLKVAGLIADAVLPAAVRAWEQGQWAGRPQGWLKIDEARLQSNTLQPGRPTGTAPRALLMLHGTFSNSSGSFKDLCKTDFFVEARKIYGSEIYGFDHFTISKTVEENARELIGGLPEGGQLFDIITYSRSGLVLRTILERPEILGPAGRRLRLGRAVLAASPNEGTPLATPARWRETVGWLATLLDHFPTNPFTSGASFVGQAIVWLASRITKSAPGLESMDGAGKIIGDLQNAPSPPPTAMSALVVNHIPDDQLLPKLVDVSADLFFGGANDLVVPSEGGWRIDPAQGSASIPAERVGCFGPGGNIAPDATGVNHLNLFGRQESARFLIAGLRGDAQPLAPIDLNARLPTNVRSGVRRPAAGHLAAPAAEFAAAPVVAQPQIVQIEGFSTFDASERRKPTVFSDTLSLTVIAPDGNGSTAQLYAQYAGARLIVPFRTHGDEDGKRWQKIISIKEKIRSFADGTVNAEEPDEDDLRELGILLFDTLLPDRVRRLYDTARARESNRLGRHLNVILTSQIPWVADIPWEFAFDRSQRCQLATEEVHFVRNALTEVPAEQLDARPGPLRMLVAVSQPADAGEITAEEEKAVIMRGFQSLIDAGLAEVEVLEAVTTSGLHDRLLQKNFDILHFIGHGEFDESSQTGRLVFEDGERRRELISVQDLRRLLRGRGLQMVYLNACQTGRGGSALFARGLAWELVDIGIHCVVANQYSVLNSSATEFAQVFYCLLAQGRTIGAAAREARIAVNYAMQRETIDWAVPVVYARNPESQLSIPTAAKPGAKPVTMATPQRSPRRRAAFDAQTPVAVAVCDIGGRFPKLAATLERLNSVQSRFAFELAEVTAPVGVLQRVQDRGTQFNADVAARRLQSMPSEMGVDYVYCLTRYPIAYTSGDYEFWNFYNWWPDDEDTRILIGSIPMTATDAARARSGRATANLLTQGLAGLRARIGTHEKGSQVCPFFTNEDLDPELVANSQHFDAGCRAKLRRKVPEDLPAFEAMLRAFDNE